MGSTHTQIPGAEVAAQAISWLRLMLLMLMLLGLGLALAGCEPVQSLNPFFESQDVVRDSDLVGTWVSKDEDGSYMKLRFQAGEDKTDGYKVEVFVHQDQPNENKHTDGTSKRLSIARTSLIPTLSVARSISF